MTKTAQVVTAGVIIIAAKLSSDMNDCRAAGKSPVTTARGHSSSALSNEGRNKKGSPSMSLKVVESKLLSDDGSDHAVWYPQTNKIVTFKGKTHVAWLGRKFETMAATYDHATGAWGNAVKVGTGVDNHAGPALTADSKGYLHVVFGPHHHPFHYARSARPNDSSEWVAMPDFADKATYPSLVCDENDTLHITYRSSTTTPWGLMYQRLPKGGKWSNPIMLAQPPAQYSGYSHFHHTLAIASDQTLHLSFNIYYEGSAKAIGHMMSRNGGNTWTLADGSPVKLPVRPDSDGVFIRRTPSQLKTTNMVCDLQGRPWISAMVDGVLEVYHHDGKAWQVLKPTLPRWPADKTTWRWPVTVNSNNRIYLVSILGPRVPVGSYSGGQGSLVVLYSQDQGKTFQSLDVLPPNQKHPYTGVNIERNTGHNPVKVPHVLIQQANVDKKTHKVIAARLAGSSD